MLVPTQRWSSGFADGEYTIGGVVTTSFLKEFLPTIDYPNGQLVLRPQSEAGRAALQGATSGQTVNEVPFALAATHLMMVRGSLNGIEDLTFFVDSGLADEDGAALTAPIQTLNYVGIPVPETSPVDDVGGLGGADFEVGYFQMETLGLGPLVQQDMTGEYGTSTPDTYWQMGFIQDGLISHNFLRNYAWTIDFSEMAMLFAG